MIGAPAEQPMLDTGRPRRRNLISLTPLIDVVFILLVFFMLASSFLDWRAVELEAPAEAGGAGSMEGAMLVEVRPDDLRLGGIAVPAAELRERVSARLAEDADTRVLVMPVAGVNMQRTVEILEALADAGVRDLSVIREGGS
ncbi:biopolymer transporter ExbD [Thioalkalivibrio sp. ALR17-21]|uniref:ExbD/TolR family protein n=1 Tax=Thioalkalivibrio sp. ALR17-21 TaxID=1269813 RepID=UPI00041D06DB|nr:biopolymer transporter ExbD [Thioalkalivibrio sp. ALR17-21]